MATKEERDKATADRAWRKATDEHAAEAMKRAVNGDPAPSFMVRNAPDQGGHAVEVRGPDGEWRRYFVRLTEVQA